jgi:fucose 4-O-acetylase-like acetyltransferase
MEKGRDEYVDTARGIACVLLVLYHVIGGSPTTGLHATSYSSWRIFTDVLNPVRMPLFAFISGYVYGWRPFVENGGRFLAGKTRRLLLPMLIVGTAFAVLQSLIPGTNFSTTNWALLHIVPVAHYWFLESLFIVFFIVMGLESVRLLGDKYNFAMVLAAAIAIYLTVYLPGYLGLGGAIYLFPYFLCGLACYRFRIRAIPFVILAIMVFAGSFGYTLAGALGYAPLVGRKSIIGLLVGVTASFVILRTGWRIEILSFLGKSSYPIFLYHVFFTASARMIADRLDFHAMAIRVVIGTVAGLLGPLLIEKLANHFAVTRTTLLGKHG